MPTLVELEDALRRSEEELRREKLYVESLLDISPSAIVTINAEGRVTSWNPSAESLFGYARHEAIGCKLQDLIANRDDLREESAGFLREFERTGCLHATTRRARKDGSLLDVDVFAVPIAGPESPTRLVVYHDVTAVSARQRAEEQYRELVEQLPLVTYIDEPAIAPSRYISPQVETLLGYSAEEWLADPDLFLRLLHPDDRDRVFAEHERAFAAGASGWSFEYRLIARDGRTVDIRDDAVVAKDGDGKPLYVQGFLMDVTKQKEAERALRASDTRFRALFEEAPIGVAWGPLDGSLYRRNRAYREMVGYSEEELSSMHFSEYTHPDDLPRELELHERLLAGKIDRYELEKRYIHKDGHAVWVHLVDSVVREETRSGRLGVTMVQDISKRRQAEDDLRRQTQYYESLLEISPVAVVTLDLDERVTSWNPAAERLFGYSAGEALDRPIGALILRTKALAEEGASVMREALTTGAAHRVSRRMRKDGSLVDVDILIVPLRSDGKTIGSYAIYHDVSELHRQKQYYESLLEVSPTAIVTVGLDSRITSWNPAAEKLFGYRREEAVGCLVDDLIAAADEIRAEAADVNRRGSAGEVELITRRTRRDGSLVDVHVLVAPIFLEGELVGRYGIYHDISELQRQKQHLQALLENSPTAIAAMDLDDTVTAWNPAAEKLFGYTQQEAIGCNIDDLVANSPEVRQEAVEINRQARELGHAHIITRRTRKDGTLVDVEVLVAPVVLSGEFHGFYGIYHDIGELVRARRQAEEATQAKSAFLATMSHEIRTPMNAVIGMTELLLDTPLTSEQHRFAEVIRTSGDSLLTIIDDILDFSKIEAGALELEHQPFGLRDCVESALDIVAASAAARRLDLACLVDPNAPPALVGDSTRLRQILVNLLTNAVKFTDEGEVVLSVACERSSSGDGLFLLRFAVRDTGIGIPAERMDRLFQSFSQVDASTTRRYGGTGLGLAISKRLSEMMGGTMWAESRVGTGSTFHFTVTLEGAPSPIELTRHPAELAGKRVLVVDDHAANREVVRRQCAAWGMMARDTGSPNEALAWVRRGDPFDIAVLDMQMPEVDGLALACEIRRSRTARELPLVLLTSLGRRKEDLEADVEFAAYLTKPIKASALYNALVAVFGGRVEEPSASAPEEAISAGAEERPPLRILLAEDNEVNRKLALLVLEKLGYSADVAVNGMEALDALRRGRYDVVLMDVEMPVMDGLEAARRIHREWPGGARPRIVAMTANAMQGDRETCLAAGMDDYLSKPIRPHELAAALARGARVPAGADLHLDLSALGHLEATMGEPALAAELVDTFLREAPSLLTTLRSADWAEQAEELRRAAHTLKSNARIFGATALADLCQTLETSAKDGTLDDPAELVGRIEDEFARVERALGALRVEAQRG
jgi:PAS domain S-box-containing protein